MSDSKPTRYDDISKRLKVNRAEQIAEGYFAQAGNILPFGFKTQTNIGIIFSKIPLIIRKAPDYVFITKGEEAKFIEVKGMADREKTFNLKVDDFAGYCFWNELMPMEVFVVSFKPKDEYDLYLTPFKTIKDCVNEFEYSMGQYEDTRRRYFSIPYKHLNKVE